MKQIAVGTLAAMMAAGALASPQDDLITIANQYGGYFAIGSDNPGPGLIESFAKETVTVSIVGKNLLIQTRLSPVSETLPAGALCQTTMSRTETWAIPFTAIASANYTKRQVWYNWQGDALALTTANQAKLVAHNIEYSFTEAICPGGAIPVPPQQREYYEGSDTAYIDFLTPAAALKALAVARQIIQNNNGQVTLYTPNDVVDYINLYGGKFIRSSSANLETITRTTYNSSLNGLQFQVKELTTQYILDISKATLCATGPDIAENYKFILSYAEPASISGQTASINTSGLVIYDVTPAKPSIGQLCAQQRSPVKISEQYQDNMLGPFFVTDVMAQRFASIFNTAIKNLAHVRRRRYR